MEFVPGATFETLLEEPGMENDRIHPRRFQHVQSRGKALLPSGTVMAEPDLGGKRMGPETSDSLDHVAQRLDVFEEGAAGRAGSDQLGVACQVQIHGIGSRFQQPAHDPLHRISRAHHELVNDALLFGPPPQPGRSLEALAQDLARGQHLGPHRPASAQLGQQTPEGAVSVTHQRGAKPSRNKAPAANDTFLEHRLPT